MCAERVAVFKAISENKMKLKKMYIYSKDGWPPCGLCRQVISEFADIDLEVVMGDKNGNEITMKFNELMPLSFTKEQLKR